VKDTVLGTSDSAAEKAKEAEQQVRDTAAAAGKKGKEKLTQAGNAGNKVQMSALDIAKDAQHAYNTQLGDSAWQKVSWHVHAQALRKHMHVDLSTNCCSTLV